MKIATANMLSRREDFKERLPKMIEELTSDSPDLILVQEAPAEYEELIKDAFYIAGYGYLQRRQLIEGRTDTVGIAYWRKTIDTEIRITETPNVDALAMDGFIRPDGDVKPLPMIKGEEKRQDSRQRFIAISYHGRWGNLSQRERLSEVSEINRWAYEKSTGSKELKTDDGAIIPVFLGGDFNAVEEERTIRYLLGQEPNDAGEYAYWTEVQNEMYDLQGRLDECRPLTTTLTDGCGRQTAQEHGIDVNYLAARRIDYIMSLGFGHGRAYGFKRADIVRLPKLSDHAFLIADTIGLDTASVADDNISLDLKSARSNGLSKELTDLIETNEKRQDKVIWHKDTDLAVKPGTRFHDTGASTPISQEFNKLNTPAGSYDSEAIDYATVIAASNPFPMDDSDADVPVTIDKNNLGMVSDDGKTDTEPEDRKKEPLEVDLSSDEIDRLLASADLFKNNDTGELLRAVKNPFNEDIFVKDSSGEKHYGSKASFIAALVDDDGSEDEIKTRFIISSMSLLNGYSKVDSSVPIDNGEKTDDIDVPLFPPVHKPEVDDTVESTIDAVKQDTTPLIDESVSKTDANDDDLDSIDTQDENDSRDKNPSPVSSMVDSLFDEEVPPAVISDSLKKSTAEQIKDVQLDPPPKGIPTVTKDGWVKEKNEEK